LIPPREIFAIVAVGVGAETSVVSGDASHSCDVASMFDGILSDHSTQLGFSRALRLSFIFGVSDIFTYLIFILLYN